MNRRKFVSLALVLLAPLGNIRSQNYSFDLFLSQIVNPFEDLSRMEITFVDQWIRSMPNISNSREFSEYLLGQIELDYVENRVALVEGIVLSETELKLYCASQYYA
jgi:hypothetical protein